MTDREYLKALDRAHEDYHNQAGRPAIDSPAFHEICDKHDVECWELADMIAGSEFVDAGY